VTLYNKQRYHLYFIADRNRTTKSSRITKAGKVTGELRALNTEDRRNLHSLPNIAGAIIEENEKAGSTKAYKVVGRRERKPETPSLLQVRASHFKCGICGQIEFSGVVSFSTPNCHCCPTHGSSHHARTYDVQQQFSNHQSIYIEVTLVRSVYTWQSISISSE